MNAGTPAFIFYVQRFTGDLEARGTVGIDDDLDIVPRDLPSPACFECLEKRLLCGKASCIRLGRGDTFRVTIGTLPFGKNTLDESRCSRDGLAYSVNFRYVDADGNYH